MLEEFLRAEALEHLRNSAYSDEAHAEGHRIIFRYLEHLLDGLAEEIRVADLDTRAGVPAGSRPNGGWADGGSDFMERDSGSTDYGVDDPEGA